jgi:hypothetical protein
MSAEIPSGLEARDPRTTQGRASEGPQNRTSSTGITIATLIILLLVRVLLQPPLRSLLMFHQPVAVAIRSNIFYLGAEVLIVAGLFAWFLAYGGRKSAPWRAINWAVLVLGFGALWPSPMILEPGEITEGNWGAQMRSAVLTRDAIWQGEFPGYTFQQGNGASYLTQYPPLATWLEALPMTLGVEPEFAMKLVAFLLHLTTISGLYFLLQRCGVHQLPAAAGAVSVTLTQQYWATGMLTGAFASWCAFALVPWATLALVALINRPSVRRSLIFGSIFGLMLPAHPVYSLFFFYFAAVGLLAGMFWIYDRLRRAIPFLLFSGVVSLCVGAPYLIPMLLYRSYNVYRPEKVGVYQFALPVFLRTLKWNPHIGSPPGIGVDFTGYIGAILWISLLIAPLLILYGNAPAGMRNLRLTIYLTIASLSLFLVYGAKVPIYRWIPYVYLNKSANRLYPFLALVLAAGFALCCERLMSRPRWLAFLIGIVLLEQLPFCTRTYFSTADTIALTLQAVDGNNSRQEILSADRNFYDRLYRGITLDRLNDFYYIHHEEIGATGPMFWAISSSLRDGDCSVLQRDLSGKLRWLGVTHLFFSEAPAPCFSGLGVQRSWVVDSIPIFLIQIDSNATIDRQTSKIVVPVVGNKIEGGRQLLPISFNPRLIARQGDRPLQLFDKEGFVEVCCLSSDREPVTVVHVWPLLHYGAYLVSFCTLLVAAFLIVQDRRQRRRLPQLPVPPHA